MMVPVFYIFSKNNKIGSKIISFLTSYLSTKKAKTPSHVCILINNKWVVESTLLSGMRVISFLDWKKINEVVGVIRGGTYSLDQIKEVYKPLKHKKYDYLGVLYFGWRILLKVLFKLPIPKKNQWNSQNKYFCCEAVGKLTNSNYEMTAPVQLMEVLNEQAKNKKSI